MVLCVAEGEHASIASEEVVALAVGGDDDPHDVVHRYAQTGQVTELDGIAKGRDRSVGTNNPVAAPVMTALEVVDAGSTVVVGVAAIWASGVCPNRSIHRRSR